MKEHVCADAGPTAHYEAITGDPDTQEVGYIKHYPGQVNAVGTGSFHTGRPSNLMVTKPKDISGNLEFAISASPHGSQQMLLKTLG